MKKKSMMWGNGIGLSPELWFKEPKEFVEKMVKGSFGSEVWQWVPKGDKTSNFFDGGFWIDKITPAKSVAHGCADMIVCLSANKKKVQRFTEVVKTMLEYPDFWQTGFARELKNRMENWDNVR